MADIKGTAAGDLLIGTTLQDLIQGLSGDDVIQGDDGGDDLQGSTGNDTIFGGNGNDLIFGGSGNDLIFDGGGNDFVNAGAGNDIVTASAGGDDTYMGGADLDTIDYSDATAGLVADLSKNTVAGDGKDVVEGFEHFIGTSFKDNIKGSSLAETIDGGAGKDVIRGMAGADVLTGGDGADRFVWKTSDVVDASGNSLGIDVIKDFQTNDTLDLRGMLPADAYSRMDDLVHLVDTAEGTMVQVSVGSKFVDVVLLEGLHTGGALASNWASDSLILPSTEPPLLA